jgi:hypothetical protein
MEWGHLKIFSRTTGPILTDLSQSVFGGKGLKFVQMKGDAILQGEIMTKELKYPENFLKSSSPEPFGQIQSNLVQIILEQREFKFFI